MSATLTANTFLGTATANAATVFGNPSAWKPNVLSIVILLIAYIHYQWIMQESSMENIKWKNIEWYRHSDWMITCPLLVYELAYLKGFEPFGADASSVGVAAGTALFMVLAGWRARLQAGLSRVMWWGVGAVCLGIIYSQLLRPTDDKDQPQWPDAFLWLWIPYGIVFWAPDALRQTLYNVLDILSKSGLGLAVAYASLTAR